MPEDDPYRQLHHLLPIVTEIPFVITNISVEPHTIDLVGAMSLPQSGAIEGATLTPVRLTLAPTAASGWRIVDIAVDAHDANDTERTV